MKSSKSTVRVTPKKKVVVRSEKVKEHSPNKVCLSDENRLITSEGWIRRRRAEINHIRGIK